MVDHCKGLNCIRQARLSWLKGQRIFVRGALLLASGFVAFGSVSDGLAGGVSGNVARRAMCEDHRAECRAMAKSKEALGWCARAYDICLEKGAFPMPVPLAADDVANDAANDVGSGAGGCGKAMMECREPDVDAMSTHDDGSPVLGDPVPQGGHDALPGGSSPTHDSQGVLIDAMPDRDQGADMLEAGPTDMTDPAQ